MRPDPGSVRGRITQCLLGNGRDASTCAGDFALGVGQPGIIGIARCLKMQVAMVPEALAIQLLGLLEPHVWRRLKGLEGMGPALEVLPCRTFNRVAAKVAVVICPQGLRFHSVCHPGQQRRDDESDDARPIAMHRCLLIGFLSQLNSPGGLGCRLARGFPIPDCASGSSPSVHSHTDTTRPPGGGLGVLHLAFFT